MEPWCKLINSEDVKDPLSKAGKTFRLRFRLPFRLFEYVVGVCKSEKVFSGDEDAIGVPSMPVEIKVLGALRTLRRGTIHDDVAEMTGAHAETHRRAFIKLIAAVPKLLYSQWVTIPAGDSEELQKILSEYARLGFPNAVGSIDATHIHWARCPAHAANNHTGKEGYPTRAFNVAVSHSGRILSCSKGHPGARNDKAIVRYDGFVNRMRFDGLYSNLTTALKSGNGVDVLLRGGYLITDIVRKCAGG